MSSSRTVILSFLEQFDCIFNSFQIALSGMKNAVLLSEYERTGSYSFLILCYGCLLDYRFAYVKPVQGRYLSDFCMAVSSFCG